LLITHFHADHDGGVVELAQLMPIRHFIDHGGLTAAAQRDAGRARPMTPTPRFATNRRILNPSLVIGCRSKPLGRSSSALLETPLSNHSPARGKSTARVDRRHRPRMTPLRIRDRLVSWWSLVTSAFWMWGI
jgi:hypothetical protein